MSFFKQFFTAVYQFDKYNHLAALKAGKVIIYEIILFLITILIPFIYFISVFLFYGGTEGIINKFVPDFKIENGVLYSDTVVFEEEGILIIVDGNNVRDEFDLQRVQNGIIFDKEKIILKNGLKNQQMSYNDFLKSIGADSFEKKDFLNYTSGINMFIIIFFVITFLALAASEGIGIIIMSLFALLINFILKKELKYSQLLKISVYARTLSVFISAVLMIFGIGLDFIFMVILNLAYLFFALKNFKEMPVYDNLPDKENI